MNASSDKAFRGLAERLHDGPLQLIASLRLNLKELEHKGGAYPEELAELANQVIDVQEELSKLVQILSNPEADETRPELALDLSDRLRKMCSSFRASSGIECQLLVIPAHARLPSLPSVVVLRTLRELLANVRKHARARVVEVSSSMRADGSVVFTVKDDGIGLVSLDLPQHDPQSGFGLWSISERLTEIGGHLEFENDDGFCVNIVLPPRVLEAASIGESLYATR